MGIHKDKSMVTAADELRSHAEERIRTKRPDVDHPRSKAEALRLVHELEVHQIELEMQNDELRRTQRQLETLQARYLDLYELAPAGYLTLSDTGLIQEANLAAATLLGTGRGRLLKQPFSRFILPDDQDKFHLIRMQLLETGTRQSCELRLQKAGGGQSWAKVEAIAAQDKDDGELTVRVVVSDINGLKRAEAELEARVKERTAALKQSHEEMKKVSFELIWAEERERERIAGELHDQVGQTLLLAKMKLDALGRKVPSGSLRTCTEEVSSLVETSIRDIRSLTFTMRPPVLDSAEISTALRWLCSSVDNDYNLQVDYTDDDQPKPLSAEVRYFLYQSVRELLLNVAKHAGVKDVRLSVKSEDHSIVVNIADNGVGFRLPDVDSQQANKRGYGLYNVKQRIEHIGGRFAVESTPGKGTSVTLMMPCTEG